VSTSTDSWWFRGDFTNDGIVNFADLVKLAQNYNTALPAGPIPGAAPGFDDDFARALATVPEPTTLPLLLLSACSFVRRRRRRRQFVPVLTSAPIDRSRQY
jgi:hypothetical protein